MAFFQPAEPGERLQGFAQPHVVGQNSAQLQFGKMAQEIQAFFLVGAQLRVDSRRKVRAGNSLEFAQPLAQGRRLRRVSKPLQFRFI